MLEPEPSQHFEFRKRDNSKDIQKYPFTVKAPPTESFDQLNQKGLSISKQALVDRGQFKKLLQKNIPIYGSKRTRPFHERSNSVFAQGKRILCSKIPPDIAADFRSESTSRMHYKATTSFYLQCDSSLMIKENDLDIKKYLGLDKEAN